MTTSTLIVGASSGIGLAEQLAETARWLLSDATLVTGQVIRADAGLSSLRML